MLALRSITASAAILSLAFLNASSAQAARVQAECFPGTPFGVGRITIQLPAGVTETIDASAFALVEKDGRTLYPSFTVGKIGKLIQSLIKSDVELPRNLTVDFLFVGDGPLKLTLYSPLAESFTITPVANPRQHQRVLNEWWRNYNTNVREQDAAGDYPAIVENYLTTMLGQRLRLPPPLLTRIEERKDDGGLLKSSLDLILGTEAARNRIAKETLQGTGGFGEPANQPLPKAIVVPELEYSDLPADVVIEPLAMRAPEECFYIRFGRLNNYLWMNKLGKEHGGDLSQMIKLRGLDRPTERQQTQLCLKQSALAELLGETVVADIALIGRDLFTQEGAAIGVLFQARNSLLLSNDIRNARAAFLKEYTDRGATLTTVKIAGKDVSFLSTPDNRLRSFWVSDGQFHLVTTSRAMIERFLETGSGKGALGATKEFRYARAIRPATSDDTIFAYLSTRFFQGLISPQYRVELRRRLQATTDIELWQLSQLAAKAEGYPAESIDDVIRAGLLPKSFGKRPDGSTLVLRGGEFVDSIRGARGTFIPVADMPIEAITASELRDYEEFSTFFTSMWKRTEPIVATVRRYALDDKGMERIVIDANIAPFDIKKLGMLGGTLGPPIKQTLTPIPGDIISIQAVTKGLSSEPMLAFVGVQDHVPSSDPRGGGFLTWFRILRSTPGYIGTWPKAGLLDFLAIGPGARPDAEGFSQHLFGLWRRQLDSAAVVSFDREVLKYATDRLELVDSKEPMQVKIHIGDLSTAKVGVMVDALTYMRARQASLGNARLMHTLAQQLKVPRDKCRETAEKLLDAKLVCALGGEYKLTEHPSGLQLWASTKWADGRYAADFALPADFHAPVQSWFRGLDAGIVTEGDNLTLHAELDMVHVPLKPGEKPTEPVLPTITLPKFDFNWGKKKDPAKPDATKPETPKPEKPKVVPPEPVAPSVDPLQPTPPTKPKRIPPPEPMPSLPGPLPKPAGPREF